MHTPPDPERSDPNPWAEQAIAFARRRHPAISAPNAAVLAVLGEQIRTPVALAAWLEQVFHLGLPGIAEEVAAAATRAADPTRYQLRPEHQDSPLLFALHQIGASKDRVIDELQHAIRELQAERMRRREREILEIPRTVFESMAPATISISRVPDLSTEAAWTEAVNRLDRALFDYIWNHCNHPALRDKNGGFCNACVVDFIAAGGPAMVLEDAR